MSRSPPARHPAGQSARRRRTDKVMRGLLLAATIVALIPLVLIIYYLLHKGLSAWTQSGFFTTDPTGSFFGSPGGIRSAILGSLEIVALATLISIPIGIGVALYLTEYGKEWLVREHRALLRRRDDGRAVDHVRPVHLHRAGGRPRRRERVRRPGRASVALALLMLPIVIRSSEVVLLLVPSSLREAALALGAPRWRVVFRVVLPTAAPGLVTGSLLAVARGMGETAPLLFTVSTAFALTFNLSQQMNTLPFLIYNDITVAASRRSSTDRVGRGADAGGDRPDPQPHRPIHRFEGAAWHDPAGHDEQGTNRYVHRRGPAAGAAAGGAGRLRGRRAAEKAGHAVKLKDLNAYYGDSARDQGRHDRLPGQRGDRADRAVGIRESRRWSGASTGCTRRSPARAPRAASTLDELDVYDPGRRRDRRAPADRDGVPEAESVPDDVDLRQRRRRAAADRHARAAT